MATTSINFQPDSSIPAGEIHMPSGHSLLGLVGQHVVARASGRTVYAVVKRKALGAGNLAHVNGGDFGITVATGGEVEVKGLWKWRTERLWSTPNGKASLVSFVIALVAGLVQIGFSVPESLVVFHVEKDFHDSVNWITKAVAPIGTVVTFATGTWNK